ncbi:MAG TPA: sialidase family protein [Myxococcales bacterium]|nr:sialidase family protein [Myxococcales bacterium]
MRSPPTLGLALAACAALACCSNPGNGGTGGQTGGATTGGGTTRGGTTRGGSGGALGQLGAGCGADSDCASGTCLQQIIGGYCSAPCAENSPCTVDGGTCVEPLPGQFACGLACTVDADCGRSGFGCDPTCKVCVPSPLEGQVSCAPSYAGGGGRLPDGGVCGTLPPAGSASWSASVSPSESDATLAEAEGAAVAGDAGTVVLAFMVTLDGGGQNEIGVATTVDDGAHFTLATPLQTQDPLLYDPSLATDSTGHFYCAFGGGNGTTQGHVYVASSTDGLTWSTPTSIESPKDILSVAGENGGGIDKPFVAVNPVSNEPNTVFTSFSGGYGGPGPYQIRIVGGTSAQTSQADLQLDIDGTRAAGRDLPNLAFDLNGFGYAVWAETTDEEQMIDDQATGTAINGSLNSSIYFAWIPLDADGLPDPPSGNTRVSAATDDVVFDVPRVAVTPVGDSIFVAYVVGNDSATDIALAVGASGGVSFAAPVIVNDDPGCATHFHPALSFDGAGNLWVSWIDNRDGDGRVYYAVSQDRGKTFSPSAPLSDAPFYFTTLYDVPAWIGGYQSLVYGNGELYSVWSGAVNGTTSQDAAHVYFQKTSAP